MKRLSHIFGTRGNSLLRAATLLAITVAFAFSLAHATPSRAQSDAPATYPPGFEFDVSTIYLSQDTSLGGVLGFLTDDSYRARNMTMKSVIRDAYGLWGGQDEKVFGGPKWLDTDRYYITAKMDGPVVDRMKKLGPDQRKLIQNQMVQALLADRLKLAIHREARELPVYTLTIAKDGLKLHEAKPGDAYVNALPYADKFAGGNEPAGKIFLVSGGGPGGNTMTIYGFGASMPALAKQLTVMAGQTVQDKTGLTGSYDFTIKYWFVMRTAPTSSEGGGPDGQSVPVAAEPAGGPGLVAAIQQQLGLKMESTKGPVEVVVIDHIERPSGN
jgi:uncharacterized protein (TIGR03435 family)